MTRAAGMARGFFVALDRLGTHAKLSLVTATYLRGDMATITATQPECTPEQGALWRERYSDGYQAGRGDARAPYGNRFDLIDVPAELPGENGAQYVARHVGIAWEIGYAAAWAYETSR